MDKIIVEDLIRKVIDDIKNEGKSIEYTQSRFGIFEDMNSAIEASAEAQKKLYSLSLQQRNEIANIIREVVLKTENLELISYKAVEETGIGKYEDKIIKNKVAAEKTPGKEDLITRAISGEYGLMIEEYCPFGVIGSITPTTNPTETIINNSISMIVGGNTVVFSPHPRAKRNFKIINKNDK